MANRKQETGNRKQQSLRVAIVHDWLVGGGAEKVVLELHRMYPNAPIYTSYATDEWRQRLGGKVVTGYLQRGPFGHLRKFLPLLRQYWFRGLDLGDFDLVISSSGNGEAKFARAHARATHICYCHTPPHFYWSKYQEYVDHPSFRPYWLARLGLKILVKPLRQRDYVAAQKIDQFVANSSHIQNDIKKYYHKDSVVIHPPVETSRISQIPPSAFHLPQTRSGFVTVGRQTPYKRVDIIVQACTRLNLPLTVVGRGPENSNLQKLAGSSVRFDTNASDESVANYLASTQAFLFAAEEDFGITPVEAMAAGTPVIAYQAGGALDYVIPGKTGAFFKRQAVESLVEALQAFDPLDYDAAVIQKHADAFSAETFARKFDAVVSQAVPKVV